MNLVVKFVDRVDIANVSNIMIHKHFTSVNEMELFIIPYSKEDILIKIDPIDQSFHIFVNNLYLKCIHCNRYVLDFRVKDQKNPKCYHCGKSL